MDPLTALSVAGTIVQFVDFGHRLLLESRELYKSAAGALAVHQEIELGTIDLRALIIKLRQSFSTSPDPLTENDQEQQKTFRNICDNAIEVAEELIERLDQLKIKNGKGGKWESIRKAVRSAWSKDEVQTLIKRLDGCRQALETRVLFSIRTNLDAESLRASSRFNSLEQQAQAIILSLVDNGIDINRTTLVASSEIQEQVSTLIQLVRRLDAANTDEHRRTRDMIVDGNIKRQFRKAEEKITASIEMLDISKGEEKRQWELVSTSICQTLRYDSMSNRYESVLEAYPRTFEWIFRDPTANQLPWSNFSQWLQTGEGVYWLSGKAGSGKSTLMKYIFDSPQTRQYLNTWASESRHEANNKSSNLCLATFFFWNSGTPEQKSQAGLLRGLLFQILSSVPSLVPIVLPLRWARTYSRLVHDGNGQLTGSWSLRELMVVFKAIIQQTTIPLNLCILVDGLDEFDGDHEEMAELFKNLVNTQHAKVCVSSRPWVIFKESFCNCPSLQLQDLTKRDIEYYVNGKFQGNAAFQKLMLQEPTSAPELLREIVEKAEGVFLWVRIVTKSLLDGIRNLDEVSILQQRLRLLPKELEPLYAHIFSLIEPIYIQWVSMTFQIIRASQEIRSEYFEMAQKKTTGDTGLSILEFLFAIDQRFELEAPNSEIPRYFVNERVGVAPAKRMATNSLITKCKNTVVQLTARCAGLLEVLNIERWGLDSPVQYLHRTVQEFLTQEERWSQFLVYTSKTRFNPNARLMKARIFWMVIKYGPNGFGDFDHLHRIVSCALLHAYRANMQSDSHKIQAAILDDLDQLITSLDFYSSLASKHWSHQLLPHPTPSLTSSFLECATLYSLSGYVRSKLSQDASSCYDKPTYLLHQLLCQKWPSNLPPMRAEMVSVLLDSGADPNWSPGQGVSTWHNALYRAATDRELDVEYLHVMKLMLLSEAATTQIITHGSKAYSAVDIVKKYLLPVYPQEGADLLSVIQAALPERLHNHRDKRCRIDNHTI